MSKFLKFKDWLTISDAAKTLTIITGEEVTETDILKFAVDGHLRLSLYLSDSMPALTGPLVPVSKQDQRSAIPITSNNLQPDFPAQGKENIDYCPGIIDLFTNVSTLSEINNLYLHKISSVAKKKHFFMSGLMGYEESSNRWFILMKRKSDHPEKRIGFSEGEGYSFQEALDSQHNPKYFEYLDEFPTDSILVIRRKSLLDFEALINEHSPNKKDSRIFPDVPNEDFLNAIGIMALIISKRTVAYRTGDKPKASAISRLIKKEHTQLFKEEGQLSKFERAISAGFKSLDNKNKV